MKTIAFFNNKGGVGKTALVYHLGHMLPRVGYPTLVADLDPQASLTTMFFSEDQVRRIWQSPTSVAQTLLRNTSDEPRPARPWPQSIAVGEGLHVLPASLELGSIETQSSEDWRRTVLGDTVAMSGLLDTMSEQLDAAVCLMDLGPTSSALNRAAVLGCDYLVVPLRADLFSAPSLRQLGSTLSRWLRQFEEARQAQPANGGGGPLSARQGMQPIGYVILERPAWRAGEKWVDEIPRLYAHELLGREPATLSPEDDANCLATLHSYRSLFPLAQEARKPMFDLRPADGAIGSLAVLTQRCLQEYRALAERIASVAGLSHSTQP